MPQIKAGVSNSATFFNLDGLDRVRGNYQTVYNDVQVDAAGNIVESFIRVGLQQKFTGSKSGTLQIPVKVNNWTDSSNTPYSLLNTLLSDMATLGVFTNL